MSFPRGLSRIRQPTRDDRGQDAFEYMLAAGTLVVVLFLGLLAFRELAPMVVGNSCPAVDTAADPGATEGSCIDESP